MIRSAGVFWLLLWLLAVVPCAAASPWQRLADPMFVRTDTRELPEAAVMSLAQDRAGFLWVGTQGGLASFDGYHFRNFLPNPSDPKALPDGYIRALLPGTGGGLWIGSSSNGLVHFDAATETFRTWRRDPRGRAGPRSASVYALAYDSRGGIWVGGDRGVDRFDPQTGSFTALLPPGRGALPIVWSLLVDRAGTVWAGTQKGLFERPAHAQRFRAFALHGPVPGSAPPVYSLAEDSAGRLWAGSVNALFEVDKARRSTRALIAVAVKADSLAPGQQWSVIEMRPGVVWAGTDAAISIVDEATLHVHRVEANDGNPGGLSTGRVVQFLRDRSGAVWLANHVGGLLWHEPFSRGLYELSATRREMGFGEQGATALAALPGDRLWAGGFVGHLVRFDARASRSIALTLPNRAAVQTLLEGRGGRLWIGSTGGLCRFDAGVARAVCPAKPAQLAGISVYTLLEEGRRLWIGGSSGLLLEDETTGSVDALPRVNAELVNDQVRVLYRDRRGRLWVGTENGLDRIDRDGRIVRFTFAAGDPNSIGPGGISTILEDRRGRIWAGASGGPLNVLEEDARGTMHVRRLGLADGLPHENVDGLAEDPAGRIWASTDKGIASIDPVTLRAHAFGLADDVSGGANWAGAVSRSDDGTIFFGGLEGIAVVAPGAASHWAYDPPLVVSALKVGRREVPVWSVNHGSASVDLPAGARDIDVEFASLDYSDPQSLSYEYKLEGYDRDWIVTDARHRIATYTHLAPGSYVLTVRGTNRRGAWSRNAFRLGVSVLPAWYETSLFRFGFAIFALFALYSIHRFRTAVLRRRQRVLEALVDERTRELLEANVRLQELSLSDPLTGLRNRRFLAEHLEADISLTLRRYEEWRVDPSGDAPQDADILFFLVDLDRFKDVNDGMGHHAGDLVLIQMRERLEEVFRDSDFVVRWGGDEFLAVARGSSRDDAGVIAERIRESVGRRDFVLGLTQRMRASVSVGFAAFPFVPAAPDAVSWLQVVTLADQALYMAKENGRNTWVGLKSTARTDPHLLAWPDVPIDEMVRKAALDIERRQGAAGTQT